MFTTPKGETVLDFGQNMVGVIEARIKVPEGTRITLRHAEVLDKDGNFYTENLRTAKATDTFICSGGEDVFMPALTFHGFRYVHVEGLGEAFDPDCFTAYGDEQLLREQYPGMKAWVEYIRSKAGDSHLWQSGHQYGDWLALDINAFSDRVGATDVYLVATAYYAYSCSLTAKAARVLGYAEDAAAYEALAGEIRAAFQKEYITATGRMVSETQTGLILALHFGLADEKSHHDRIVQSLIGNLRKHNNHLLTGFVGTPYLCHTLSEIGQHEIAGDVFLKEDYPSWLHCVGLGATTIWERWDSQKADGSFDESGMNSLNHYAYGSIGSWMYEKLGGLGIIEPGYKKSRIEPKPILGITMAHTSLKTVYGDTRAAKHSL